MKLELIEIEGRKVDLPMLIHVSRLHTHTASRISWHSHKGFELLFLLEGATSYEFDNHTSVQLPGGHFLVVPPGVVHRGLHDMRAPSTTCGMALNTAKTAVWKNTIFRGEDVRRMRSALQQGSCKVHPLNPPLRWLVRRLMDEIVNFDGNLRSEDQAVALRAMICAVLVEVMRRVLTPPTVPKEFVAAAITYLREHLHEQIQIPDLVKHLGFSRARMFEMFKLETGLTPNDYLQRLRVERAKELLKTTRKSVTEIALNTGFTSGQYFCTVFRRYAGISPVSYRNAKSSGEGRSRKPSS